MFCISLQFDKTAVLLEVSLVQLKAALQVMPVVLKAALQVWGL